MRARLGCVLVSLLLVGADGPPVHLAETRLEFPPGSRWKIVKGWEDGAPMESGCVVFYADDQVYICWRLRRPWGNGKGRIAIVLPSDLSLRMLGGRLELLLPAGLYGKYGLRLLLERRK
jgi:hypothetical protein